MKLLRYLVNRTPKYVIILVGVLIVLRIAPDQKHKNLGQVLTE